MTNTIFSSSRQVGRNPGLQSTEIDPQSHRGWRITMLLLLRTPLDHPTGQWGPAWCLGLRAAVQATRLAIWLLNPKRTPSSGPGTIVLPAGAGAAFRRSLEEGASHACWAEQAIGGRILACPVCALPPSSFLHRRPAVTRHPGTAGDY
ncbi:hypothetical protein VTN96DRAFT_4463 [Rasamsonia emersonii]